MLLQIIIGLSVIVATAFIHAGVLTLTLKSNKNLTNWAQTNPHFWSTTTALAVSVIWVMSAHLIEVVLWSAVYLGLGLFDTLETSIYFALVSYTTLGFGDIILPEGWRLLSGLTAANGFLVFGWSTAFQVEFLSRLRTKTVHEMSFGGCGPSNWDDPVV